MSEVPDGFEMVKDGTVRLHVDGRGWKLRRPKVGEYRKLRELFYETSEQARDLTKAATAAAEAAAAKPEDEDAAAEVKRTTSGLSDGIEDLWGEWMAETFKMLGDHALPEAQDDWPVWLLTVKPINDLFEHWRAVPLARSVG